MNGTNGALNVITANTSGSVDASIAILVEGFTAKQDTPIFIGDSATTRAARASTASGLTLTAINGIIAFFGTVPTTLVGVGTSKSLTVASDIHAVSIS